MLKFILSRSNSLKKKDIYMNTKEYSFEEIKEYLTEILEIRFCDDLKMKIRELEKIDLAEHHVWTLYGEKQNKRICLQVRQSKDIKKEIIRDIELMDAEQEYKGEQISVNTQFYKDTYMRNREANSSCIYNIIKREYTPLTFYYINVDKYLGIDRVNSNNATINSIVNVSKEYYAETKFAYDTQAIFWNVYRSGVGMEALKDILNTDKRTNMEGFSNE